jgi:hypothetical protein
MWFIFPAMTALFSVSAALFSLTGGMHFAVVAAAASEWQRRKGYKAGEGELTQRANDKYYGVRLDDQSGYDLNKNLGRLSNIVPGLFEKMVDKEFDLTISEGEFLRTLLSPTLVHLGNIEEVIELVTQENNQEMIGVLSELTELLKVAIVPVVRWLEEFPAARTRKAS